MTGTFSVCGFPIRCSLDLGPCPLVCELGFEGVVAKNHSSLYRPNDRVWIKVKNPNYWRRDAEREALVRSQERWARARGYASGASPS